MLRLLLTLLVPLQAAVAPPGPAVSAEERTALYFESIRRDPVALRPFLRSLPKGGDLHSHLTGSGYAESYLRWAAEDALCVDTATHTILAEREPCDAAQGRRPAKDAVRDSVFHDALVDAMSVRYHHASRGAGEYQFFGAFRHLGPLTRSRRGDLLAEVRRRAASQNVSYLELTTTWDVAAAYQAAEQVEWSDDLGLLRERLLAAGLRDAARTTHLDAAEQRMKEVLRCGTAEADPGCAVTVRYHAESYRGVEPVRAFAMMVWSFLQNEADARFVGINLVMPEDGPIALRDYDLHMKMVAFLRARRSPRGPAGAGSGGPGRRRRPPRRRRRRRSRRSAPARRAARRSPSRPGPRS